MAWSDWALATVGGGSAGTDAALVGDPPREARGVRVILLPFLNLSGARELQLLPCKGND